MPVRRFHLALAASTVVLVALGLFCQREAVAQQIVLSSTRNLDFGRFVAGSGGTIILGPTGIRSRTGGVVLLTSPATGPAMFNVGKGSSGADNMAVVISLPASGSTRLSSGANSMTINTFVHHPQSLVSLPNGGTTLSVGATLVVAPNQPPGSYTGSFPVTVNFQ